MKKMFAIVICSYFCIGVFAQTQIACGLYENNCKIGIGTPTPGEKLHLVDGHFLIEGGGETAIIMKRDITYSSLNSGESKNPMFYSGRLTQAGDGDPEYRFLYKDDNISGDAIPVFEFDRKGIVASVKPALPSAQSRGSHFEGFYQGSVNPYFRLNSYPRMRLEMGDGGTTDLDVAIERLSEKKLGFYTGTSCQMVIDPSGKMGLGTLTPRQKIEIADGNLLISNKENGLILTSPSGTQWKFRVDDNGELYKEIVSSVKKIELDDKIKIYPNPTNSIITVELKDQNYDFVDLEILNFDGKMLFMKQFRSNVFDIDINDFSAGIYFLNIKDRYGNLKQTKKIIKN